MICIILVAGHNLLLESEILVNENLSCFEIILLIAGRQVGQICKPNRRSEGAITSQTRPFPGDYPGLLVERCEKVLCTWYFNYGADCCFSASYSIISACANKTPIVILIIIMLAFMWCVYFCSRNQFSEVYLVTNADK